MAEVILKDYTDEWGYEYVVGMGNNSGSAISALINAAKGQPTTLRISSVGGSCYAAIEIITAIKAHGNVTAQIDGVAFSAAAGIACACNKVIAGKYTMMMIHNSRIMADMWGTFTAEDLRELAESSVAQMEAFDNLEAELFAEKTGLSLEQIKEMLSQETWMSATEAQALGFVDEITGEEMEAVSRKAIAHAPMRLVAMAGDKLKIKEQKNMSVIEEIKAEQAESKGLLTEILALFKGKPKAEAAASGAEVATEETAITDEAPKAKTAEELQVELDAAKQELAVANQKNEAADAALLEAKALTAETKTLLAEVRSNYKPDASAPAFSASAAAAPEGNFVKPIKKR